VTLDPEDVVFRARALAQSHPLTPLSLQYLNRAVAEQRTSQAVPEIGIWAGAGLTVGYCLRRVEEVDAGVAFEPVARGTDADLDSLDERAVEIAAEMRTDGADAHLLAGADKTLPALDRIIAGEVDRRLEHWRDSVDDKGWAELEEYITWWVVKGYALRVAESAPS